MSVFKCDITFKQIPGNSYASTRNKLIAHGFINNLNVITDLIKFRAAHGEIKREFSNKLGREVSVFKEEVIGKKIQIFPVRETFDEIDGKKSTPNTILPVSEISTSDSVLKSPETENFQRDIRFFRGDRALMEQEQRDLSPESTEHKLAVEAAIKNVLPAPVAETIKVVQNVPLSILGLKGLYFSMQSILEKTDIKDPLLVNWLGVNKDKVNAKTVKDTAQLNEIIEREYKQRIKSAEPFLKGEAKNQFDNWLKALQPYPTAFKDQILKYAIKHLINPSRENKFVISLSEVALSNAFRDIQNQPHKLNQAGKIYNQELLKTTSDATEHERSASGKGYWVHVPRTATGKYLGYYSYEEFKTTTENKIKYIREGLDGNEEILDQWNEDYNSMLQSWEEDTSREDILEDKRKELIKLESLLVTTQPSAWTNLVSQHKANVELLRKLSPHTWCTASSMASHYVENYDNYLLIVDGRTVAGIEASPMGQDIPDINTYNYIDLIGREVIYKGEQYKVTKVEEEVDFKTGFINHHIFTITSEVLKDQKKVLVNEVEWLSSVKKKTTVKEITSLANNGIAPIDHLDDILAFFEKHNLDTNNPSLQRAIKARNEGKKDKDIFRFEEDYDTPFDYRDPFEHYDFDNEDEHLALIRATDAERERAAEIRGLIIDISNLQTSEEAIQIMNRLSPLDEGYNNILAENLSKQLLENEEVATLFALRNYHFISFIDNTLPFYKELAHKAVVANPKAFSYISEETKQESRNRDIYNTYEKEIDDLLFSKTRDDLIQGYYDANTDSVVVISSNTPLSQAAAVGIHEVAHRGMLRLAKEIGGVNELHAILKGAEAQFMQKLPELLKRTGHTSLENLMLDYGFETINGQLTKEGEIKLYQELAARWAETFVTKPQPSWWKQLLIKIGDWIKQFTGKQLDENEVNELVGQFVQYGAKQTFEEVEPVSEQENLISQEENLEDEIIQTQDILSPEQRETQELNQDLDKIISEQQEQEKKDNETLGYNSDEHGQLRLDFGDGLSEFESEEVLNEQDYNEQRNTRLSTEFIQNSDDLLWVSREGFEYPISSFTTLRDFGKKEIQNGNHNPETNANLRFGVSSIELSDSSAFDKRMSESSLEQIWQEIRENNDLETSIIASAFVAQKFLSEPNSFFGRTLEALNDKHGVSKTIGLSFEDNMPMLFVVDQTVYINVQRMGNLFSFGDSFGTTMQILEDVLNEETIHLATNTLATEEELIRVYDELSKAEREGIATLYGDFQNKKGNRKKISIANEYLRMLIQDTYTGRISESIKPTAKSIIEKVLAFLRDVLGNNPTRQSQQILNRFDNLVNGVVSSPQNIRQYEQEISSRLSRATERILSADSGQQQLLDSSDALQDGSESSYTYFKEAGARIRELPDGEEKRFRDVYLGLGFAQSLADRLFSGFGRQSDSLSKSKEGNLVRFEDLQQEIKVKVGTINTENRKISGFSTEENDFISDIPYKEVSRTEAEVLFSKQNKSEADFDDLTSYGLSYFLNAISSKEGLLNLGYNRLERIATTKPKFLVVEDNKKQNPFFQYNNVIIIGLQQLKSFIQTSTEATSFEKLEEVLDIVAQEEAIHLFADYLLYPEDVNNIYKEMSAEDIKNIEEFYGKKNLPKENVVHEYIRMIVQQRVFGKSTEYATLTLNNATMLFFEKLLKRLQKFLSSLIGDKNTTSAIEDVIAFTKGEFSSDLDKRIQERVFNEGVILESQLNNYLDSNSQSPTLPEQFNLSKDTEQRVQRLNQEQWFESTIIPLIDRMNSLFPQIRTQVISINNLGQLPADLRTKIEQLQKQGLDVNSFYHNGQVYVIKERVNKEILIEEFLHPFINALEQSNPSLYKNLLAEAKKAFPTLKNQVFEDYKDVYGSVFELNREFLTQALAKTMSEAKQEVELPQEQQTWLSKFIDWIKSVLNKLANQKAKERYEIQDLSSDMSLSELSLLLQDPKTVFENVLGSETSNNTVENIQFSLTKAQVDSYLKQSTSDAQRKFVQDFALKTENIKRIDEVTPEGNHTHRYEKQVNSVGAVNVPMKSVTSVVYPNPYTGNTGKGRLGTAIHTIAEALNNRTSYFLTEAEVDIILKNAGLEEFVTKDYEFESDEVQIKSKELGREILNQIAQYLGVLKQRGSLLMSEVVVGTTDDSSQQLAGTMDIIEVTQDGRTIIHDFKSASMFYTKKEIDDLVAAQPFYDSSGNMPLTVKAALDRAAKENVKRHSKQMSLYAGIMADNGLFVDEIVIVPIIYKQDDIRDEKGNIVEDRINIRYGNSRFNVYLSNPNEGERSDYLIRPNFNYAKTVGVNIKSKPSEAQQRKQRDISDAAKIQNSTEFEKIMNNVFAQVERVVTQYRGSQDLIKQEIYKIFSKDGQTDLRQVQLALSDMFEKIAEGKAVRDIQIEFNQILNYITDVTAGVQNLYDEYVVNVKEPKDINNRQSIINHIELLQKVTVFAKSFKETLNEILQEMDKGEVNKTFIREAVQESLTQIQTIEDNFYKQVTPLLARVMEMYYTPETKQEIIDNLNKESSYYEEQLKKNPDSKYAKEKIAENEKLKQLYVPDKTVFQVLIEGKEGDAPALYSHLMAFINSNDLVTGTAAGILKEVMDEHREVMMKFNQNHGSMLDKLIKLRGDKRENVTEFQKGFTYVAPVLTRDKDGNRKTMQQKFFVTDVDETVYYLYSVIEADINDLRKQKYKLQNEGAEVSEIEAVQAKIETKIKERQRFEDTHFEPKFVKEYRDALDMLDVEVKLGDETRNPRQILDEILNNLRRIQSSMTREDYLQRTMSEDLKQEHDDLFRQMKNLTSDYDLNGTEKSEIDKQVAEVFRQRREILDRYRETKTNKEKWQKYLDRIEATGTPEEIEAWHRENSRMVLKDKDQKDKEKAQKNLTDFLATIRTTNPLITSLEEQNQAFWKQIFSLTKAYRRRDNTLDSERMPESIKAKVVELERNIQSNKDEIKELSEDLSENDKKILNGLYREVSKYEVSLQTSEYIETKDHHITVVAELLGVPLNQVDEEQLYRHSEWFRNNHIVSTYTYIDQQGLPQEKTEYKPAYYYRTISPVTEYAELSPAEQYTETDYTKALTANREDMFGRPRVRKSSPYFRPKHFVALQSNSELATISDYFKSAMEEIQQGLHKNNMVGYAVPTLPKEVYERLRAGDFKGMRDAIERNFVKTEQDIDEGITEKSDDTFGKTTVLTDLMGNEVRFLPVRHTTKLEAENQSDDVFQATLLYAMSANKTKLMESKKAYFEVLESRLRLSNPAEKDEKGNTIVDAIGNKLKSKFNVDTEKIVPGTSNVRADNIRELIDRAFFDIYKKNIFEVKSPLGGKTITDTKIIDFWLGQAGSRMMMTNVPNWVVNAISGNIQTWIEAIGSRYYTKSDRLWAEKNVYGFGKNILRDRGKMANLSYESQMTEYFDYLQGDYINEWGEKTSWNTFLKAGKQSLFVGKIYGEWEMQTKLFLSMMKAKKVKQVMPNGEEKIISLWEAYEKGKDGVPVLKPNIVKLNGELFTKQDETAFRRRIQGVNKKLNGSYAQFDQLKAEKYSFVRALTFMRKYFMPLFMNRFGAKKYDVELGEMTEGYYVTTFSLLKDWVNLKDSLYDRYKRGDLTEDQIYNLKRVMADLAFLMGFLIVLALVAGIKDDDDEWLQRMEYVFLKARREHVTTLPLPFLGLQEFYSVFKSPYIMMAQMGHFIKFGESMMLTPLYYASGEQEWFADDVLYQKRTGAFEKGDLKLTNNFLKAFGIKHEWLTAPENLEKAYNYQVQW